MIETRFSLDRLYRYTLTRDFTSLPLTAARRYCMFIGLNPSTADESKNDPTIRRCIDFAQRWGYDSLIMTNLFAFRATKPGVMKAQAEPVGKHNNLWLVRCARVSDLIVVAWGRHGKHNGRDADVWDLLTRQHSFKLMHFGRNENGTPMHPLMLPKTSTLEPFQL